MNGKGKRPKYHEIYADILLDHAIFCGLVASATVTHAVHNETPNHEELGSCQPFTQMNYTRRTVVEKQNISTSCHVFLV